MLQWKFPLKNILTTNLKLFSTKQKTLQEQQQAVTASLKLQNTKDEFNTICIVLKMVVEEDTF